MIKIYSAGAMRGIEQWNFPAFKAARDGMRTRGYEVICPAELDEAEGIVPGETDPTPDMVRAAIRRDVLAIIDGRPDALSILPDSFDSLGVKVEIALSRFLGMKIKPLNEWLTD